MTATQENKQAFIDHKVITDVLPGNTELSYDLTVQWPEATLENAGVELGREETQAEPTLYLNPTPLKPLDNLILIMTDPDLMMNDDNYFGQVRHWFAANVSTKSDGSLIIPKESELSPYVGPSPLPNYLYSRPHRYVFIVASISGNDKVTMDDFRELQKPYVAAMAGNQESQDIKDRWGFNAQKLIEMKGLKVEAATFMRVGGTLKSAANTTGLMAQGMANKVIGK